MKKISIFVLFAFVGIARADDIGAMTRNAFTFSVATTSAVDQAWQVYNPTTSVRHLYVNKIAITSQGAGFVTLYSTNTSAGFAGTKSTGTAVSARLGSGTSSSVCWTSNGTPSSYTGNVVWQGVVLASTTFSLIDEDNPIQIPPGYALYAVKTNTASAKSSVSFFFVETYAP